MRPTSVTRLWHMLSVNHTSHCWCHGKQHPARVSAEHQQRPIVHGSMSQWLNGTEHSVKGFCLFMLCAFIIHVMPQVNLYSASIAKPLNALYYYLVPDKKESFKGSLKSATSVSSQIICQWVPECLASNMEGPTAECTGATSRNQ